MEMDIFFYSGAIIIAISFMVYLKPRFIMILSLNNIKIRNYSGKEIINSGGLVLLIPCLMAVLPLWKIVGERNIIIYTVLVFAMTLIGYLDDSLGDNRMKGLKGHLEGIMEGYFSTGMLKLIITGVVGFIISGSYYHSFLDIIFHAILFCLCVNFINLLDLRPGRAIKGFALLVLILFISSRFQNIWIILPLLSSLSLYIKEEMAEVYMLGDTGSNLMGGILGMYAIKIEWYGIKYIFFVALLFLHSLAEFKSFSKIIESNPILKQMDRFGQLKRGRS